MLRTSVLDYSQSEDIDDAIVQYHTQVNDMVNEFVYILLTEAEPNIKPVSDDSECEDGNVSTYCLAVKINDELLGFEEYMVSRYGELAEAAEGEDEYLSLEEMIEASASKETKIAEELTAAEDSLDLLLYTYNQIQIVYPVHKIFVGDGGKDEGSLLGALNNFNKSLRDVRDEVEVFPSTFNDATTVKCQ